MSGKKMYDMKKFLLMAVIFIGAATLPFWYGLLAKSELPVPDTSNAGTSCVEDRGYMRTQHMVLLHQWRDSVVRENNRTYTNSHGVSFEKSLSKTCLGCHESKEKFCESCHRSAGVDLYCFDCHNSGKNAMPTRLPKENPHE